VVKSGENGALARRLSWPGPALLTPFREFTHTEAAGGIVLLLAAVVALIWANSPWSDSYIDLWHTMLTVEIGDYALSKDLVHWINDGLMAVFFFVIGLEIKRELIVGELSSFRQASLPVAAALGGSILPALIYLAFNLSGQGTDGWGIPMATDIAFALGVLALLGARVPAALLVFVTALAIVDDIIAVLVISLFYTENIRWSAMLAGLGVFGLMLLANRAGVHHPGIYGALAVLMWVAFIESGVHATVAGVLAALAIPARTRIEPAEFVERGAAALAAFTRASAEGASILTNTGQQSALQELESAAEHVQAPTVRLEHSLHPWVVFFIMPLFALANAGVSLGDNLGDAAASRISLGIIAGLVLGKQLGVLLATWLAVRTGLSALPSGASWRHIYGAACLAGIGFTMSLFIADLAFLDANSISLAKIGILAASILAGALGWIILRTAPAAPSAQAEAS
jgi:NhaA family Na+:H+ antiporter